MTNALRKSMTYSFDHEGRQTGITHPDPDGAGSLTSPTEAWTYNLAGSTGSYTDPRGGVTYWEYDDLQNDGGGQPCKSHHNRW